MNPRRTLHVLGTAELTTLVLLLLNLVTVHLPAFSRVLGPVHGLAYTATVIAAVLPAGGRHRVWLRALVPGIGGLLAARVIRAGPDRASGGPAPAARRR
ncbi:hypothetical protein [Amycolatopsis sp. NPDC004378]